MFTGQKRSPFRIKYICIYKQLLKSLRSQENYKNKIKIKYILCGMYVAKTDQKNKVISLNTYVPVPYFFNGCLMETHIFIVMDHGTFFFSQKSTVTENTDSIEAFSALVHFIQTSQSELLELTEKKQKLVERQAERLIKDLEQEITLLKQRDTQLEQLLLTEDHIHLLQVNSVSLSLSLSLLPYIHFPC